MNTKMLNEKRIRDTSPPPIGDQSVADADLPSARPAGALLGASVDPGRSALNLALFVAARPDERQANALDKSSSEADNANRLILSA